VTEVDATRIRTARMVQGISQSALARKLGLTDQSQSHLRRRPARSALRIGQHTLAQATAPHFVGSSSSWPAPGNTLTLSKDDTRAVREND
jgi:hypothetical protein